MGARYVSRSSPPSLVVTVGELHFENLPDEVARDETAPPHHPSAVRHREGRLLPRLDEVAIIHQARQRRVEHVQDQTSAGHQMHVNTAQARELLLDRQQVLKGTKRDSHQTKLLPQSKLPHVRVHQLHPRLHVRGLPR